MHLLITKVSYKLLNTIKNTLVHDGLFWSQTSENASQLTHDDDREKRHASRVIHLLDRIEPSQIGICAHHEIVVCLL